VFYVYALRDPRDRSTFYVGKGQGDRAYQHQREVINGTATSNPAKIAKIRMILAAGRQVEVAILAEYQYEEDALDHEFHLIENDPLLTNVMPGGSTQAPTPLFLAARRVKRLKQLLLDLRSVQQRNRPRVKQFEHTCNRLQRRCNERDKAAIEAWIARQPRPSRAPETLKAADKRRGLPPIKLTRNQLLARRIELAVSALAKSEVELSKLREITQKIRARAAGLKERTRG
jgi:hypothetical protein